MAVVVYRSLLVAHQEKGTNVHRPDRYNSQLIKMIAQYLMKVYVQTKGTMNILELLCSGKPKSVVMTIPLNRLMSAEHQETGTCVRRPDRFNIQNWYQMSEITSELLCSGKPELVVMTIPFNRLMSAVHQETGTCVRRPDCFNIQNWYQMSEITSDEHITDYSYRSRPCIDMQHILCQKDPVVRQCILKRICVSIARESKDVLRVFPSYRYGQHKDNIVFVAITTKELDALPNAERCPLVQRSIDSYCDEGIVVTNYIVENKIWFSHEDSAKLRQCLQKHSKRLMKQHSNLTMISACSVKSTNYKENNLDAFTRQCCIVLYVHVKGYIPDNEAAFPKHLDNIPVDVREGRFQFFGPRDYHQRLKMGCRIASDYDGGTLGPFIRFQNKTYCLTSAHAVLNDSALRDLSKKEELIYKHDDGPLIYQPSTELPANKFGRLVYAKHQPGGNANAGFEIAVIQVDDRLPDSGKFPDKYREQTGIERELYFSSGQTYDSVLLQSGFNLYMYGSESGFTEGYFSLDEAGIRSETLRNKDGVMFQWEFILHRQIIVHSAKREKPFAQPGDSGALVFVANREDKSNIQAIGILEGIAPDGNYFITPLSDILAAFNHPQMMTFTSSRTEDQIDSILEIVKNIQNMLNQ